MLLFIQHFVEQTRACISNCSQAPQEQSQDILFPLMTQVLSDNLQQLNLSQLYTMLYSESVRALASRLDQHDPLRKTDTFSSWRMLLDMDCLKRLVYLNAHQYRIVQSAELYHWVNDWDEESTTYYDAFIDAVDAAWLDFTQTHPCNEWASPGAGVLKTYLCYTLCHDTVTAHVVDASGYQALEESARTTPSDTSVQLIFGIELHQEPVMFYTTVDIAEQSVDIPVQTHLQRLACGESVSWTLHPCTTSSTQLN